MFRTQSKETYESGLYTTTGMDIVVTAERVILIDTQVSSTLHCRASVYAQCHALAVVVVCLGVPDLGSSSPHCIACVRVLYATNNEEFFQE